MVWTSLSSLAIVLFIIITTIIAVVVISAAIHFCTLSHIALSDLKTISAIEHDASLKCNISLIQYSVTQCSTTVTQLHVTINVNCQFDLPGELVILTEQLLYFCCASQLSFSTLLMDSQPFLNQVTTGQSFQIPEGGLFLVCG